MGRKEKEMDAHRPEPEESWQNRQFDSIPIDDNQAWDTISVIAKLVEAADILLHKKDYDGHGWEEIEICYKRGLEILQQNKKQPEESSPG